MTTLTILVERVRRILSGGYPAESDRIKDEDIEPAIIASISNQLKINSLNTNYNVDGGSIPSGSFIATYEDKNALTVLRATKGRSRVLLPAQPILMPERSGVFSVYPDGYPEREFMPLPPGTINIWQSLGMLNSLNEITYCHENAFIEIYHDLIGAGIPKVAVKLCVVDVNTMDRDSAPVPISQDMEGAVINEALQMLGVMAKPQQETNP